ncbi:D-Tyr-tRNA(Tyr) deacylase family protein isoform X2 [Carex rostrata]
MGGRKILPGAEDSVPRPALCSNKTASVSGFQRARRSDMRAVVQRVLSASVEVEGRIVSEIGPGLLVLVGIHESDTDSDADYICRKVLNMRLFPNDNTGKAWDQSVVQRNYGVLLVSQFTLYGVLKGNKPDFHVAMPPQKAKPFYASLVEKFQKAYSNEVVKDGIFGAMMKVNLVNDGPVTMQLDSSTVQESSRPSAIFQTRKKKVQMLRFQPQTNRNALYLQLHPTKWPICRKWAFLKFNLGGMPMIW